MAIALADKVTLARLVITPLIVGSYLLLPVDYCLCFWVPGLLCALAEYTDLADGRIARRRNEVSDFGKLADPFCDVIYRISVFLVYLLPAGGVGYVVGSSGMAPVPGSGFDVIPFDQVAGRQPVYVIGGSGDATTYGAGLVPWLPVYLMVMREVVAGALRAMAATRGLVLAARTSGKVKAWMQGIALIFMMGLPAFWFHRYAWHLTVAYWATWACAAVSLGSIVEYIWVNRGVLRQLLERQTLRAP
jgi:CDP-diacylglycerol--glycerol-3-phosphate 3-phosphatidyltransferase